MATRSLLLFLSLLSLILFARISSANSSGDPNSDAVDDDLGEGDLIKFLQEDDQTDALPSHSEYLDPDHADEGGEDADEMEDFDNFGGADGGYGEDQDYSMPEVDDKDVVVLKERNFTTVIENNQYVLVEFYAPWCGHCQSLAPEYAAAATELKADGVVLAKVDATEENELAQEYDVQGFPTVLFFVDGVHRPYGGQRTKDGIVTWIKKKTGPGIYNITTVEDAEQILTSENKILLGFLNSLVGSESNELAAASRLEDDVNFYQTINSDVAKLFHLDSEVKRPALVLIKKDIEKLSYFDGKFEKSAIKEFVFANKLPLVTNFTRETASVIFESPIVKQLLLFTTSKDSEKHVPVFREAAKFFKGKLIFVYVQMDNEEVGKPVSEYFGVSGDDSTIIAYTGNEDGRKFGFDGELSLERIKVFGEDFLADKLKPFFKSDPIPDNNDGDVKIVVGNNFDDVVLDESKDVLLEIYAPWCGHCQTLEPIYNKLAKHLRSIDSLVVAKMDGTSNEHPRAKADGFPTLLFFPAGNKSFDPITVDADRTVVAFYKFLKKHAAIPFKLQKPASSSKPDASVGSDSESISETKDEL